LDFNFGAVTVFPGIGGFLCDTCFDKPKSRSSVDNSIEPFSDVKCSFKSDTSASVDKSWLVSILILCDTGVCETFSLKCSKSFDFLSNFVSIVDDKGRLVRCFGIGKSLGTLTVVFVFLFKFLRTDIVFSLASKSSP